MIDKITLAALRIRAGYNQTEASAALGISRDTLHKWERDSGKMPAEFVNKAIHLYQAQELPLYIGKSEVMEAEIRRAAATQV